MARKVGRALACPDDRRYPPRPLIGVGAIMLRRDRVLMARRGTEPLKGWWSLPGGLLEIGETLECAVRREAREETGLEVRPLGVLEIFERIMRDQRRCARISLRADRLRLPDDRRDPGPGDDVCAVEWVRRRDLANLEITEGTLAVIEKAFRERRKYR